MENVSVKLDDLDRGEYAAVHCHGDYDDSGAGGLSVVYFGCVETKDIRAADDG
jgi:hypothetical protein